MKQLHEYRLTVIKCAECGAEATVYKGGLYCKKCQPKMRARRFVANKRKLNLNTQP